MVTRLEIEIGDLVLRGFPPTSGESLGAVVEERIGALARGEEPAQALTGDLRVADAVARQVWAQVRRETGDVWGERS